MPRCSPLWRLVGLALAQAPSGPPIRIGSTLALTGPLSATAQVHKIVGEIYVEQANKRGGWLGRPLEWIVKDDQSKPDLARTLYEQLVTVDKVDLLMGPYATGAILSAMGVAQRYDKVLVHHTFGIPSLAKYEHAFPAWSLGSDPGNTVPNTLFDALAAGPKPPKTVAVVTSKFPSIQFMSAGAREVAKKRGLHRGAVPRVGLRQPRLRPDRQPHQGRQARLRLGRRHRPGRQPAARRDEEDRLRAAAALLPVPGAGTAGHAAGSEERAVGDDLRGAAAVHQQRRARPSSSSSSASAPPPPSCPTPSVEVQAAASYTAWQILEAGVTATKSLDDKAIAAWLKANKVDTIQGKLRFDGAGNYGDDLMRIKQVQNGHWIVVWPKEFAAAGRQAAEPTDGRRRMSGCTMPSATLLAQSVLSGVFVGALYGLLGLGLSLSWGLLRLINLAHFAFAFLAAYLCYQMAHDGRGPAAVAGAHRAAVLRARRRRCTGR